MLIGETDISSGRSAEIAELTGTHIKTVQRWFRTGKFPAAIELLLRLVYGGELGLISPEWDGFWIQRRYGCLVTDQGYTFEAGEVRAWQIRCHQMSHLKIQVRQLESTISDLRATIALQEEQQRNNKTSKWVGHHTAKAI